MLPTNPLPPELIAVLVTSSSAFASTAHRFHELSLLTIKDSYYFPRVCEIHNTLDLISASKNPAVLLDRLRTPISTQPPQPSVTPHSQYSIPSSVSPLTASISSLSDHSPQSKSAETEQYRQAKDTLGFLLNAEFLLFQIYREYELRLNPNLHHWVRVCGTLKKYLDAKRKKSTVMQFGVIGSGKRGGDGEEAEWVLRETVLKIRAGFVKGLLGGFGEKLAVITPDEFASKGDDFSDSVNLRAFHMAIQAQGVEDLDEIDDELDALYRNGYTPSTIPNQPPPNGDRNGLTNASNNSDYGPIGSLPSRRTSVATTTNGSLTPPSASVLRQMSVSQPTQETISVAQLTSLLNTAKEKTLPTGLCQTLLTQIASSQILLNTCLRDLLSPVELGLFILNNKLFARDLVLLTFAHHPRQPGPHAEIRQALFTTLGSLPIELESLEVLHFICEKTKGIIEDEEVLWLAHRVINSAIRAVDEMDGRHNDMGGGGGASGGGQGRNSQIRAVQLLCLFIKSLLSKNVITGQDVYYEVLELGTRFVFVKDARELKQSLNG
ncbi:hypothetical protein RUND412_004473 [Rhizina undulata]